MPFFSQHVEKIVQFIQNLLFVHKINSLRDFLVVFILLHHKRGDMGMGRMISLQINVIGNTNISKCYTDKVSLLKKCPLNLVVHFKNLKRQLQYFVIIVITSIEAWWTHFITCCH